MTPFTKKKCFEQEVAESAENTSSIRSISGSLRDLPFKMLPIFRNADREHNGELVGLRPKRP
jgi:hypothetical protein